MITKRAVFRRRIREFGNPCVYLIAHIFFSRVIGKNYISLSRYRRSLMTTRPVRGRHVAVRLPQRRRSLAEHVVTLTDFYF